MIPNSYSISEWNQKSSIPAEGRHRTTGFSIGTKGYIALGHYNSGNLGNVAFSDVWEYDSSADTWTQKADYAGGPTYGATAFTIGNKAYMGGHVYNSFEFFSFNPVSNVWQAISSPVVGGSDRCSFSINNKGYFITGNNLSEYDPNSDTWTLKASPPNTVSSWSSATSINDNGYLLSANGGFYEYKQTVDQWITRTPFPGEADGARAFFESNGKGYVVCGYIGFLNPVSKQVWEFNPQTNSWFQMDDFPGTGRRFSSTFTIGTKAYIGTGTNGTNLNDFWEFDITLTDIDETDTEIALPYPSPSYDYINFNFESNSGISLSIYSIDGRQLMNRNISSTKFKISKTDFGKGTFLYVIKKSEKTVKKGKIIFI